MESGLYYSLLWIFIITWVTGIFFVNRGLGSVRRKAATDERFKAYFSSYALFLEKVRWLLWSAAIVMAGGGIMTWYYDHQTKAEAVASQRKKLWPSYDKEKVWEAPDPFLASTDEHADMIQYGRQLIANTQDYFGKGGIVRPASINGMNCQNCHLEAGSKPFGNNYFGVASTYPQMRARSGSLETIPKRINDCFERSLNGEPLDSNSREMKAMIAYIQWLGTAVPKGEKPKGAGLAEVPFLNRAASPEAGKIVYEAKCASCHGSDGKGLPIPDSPRRYPPLWGDESYNEGAGLFRMSRFAAYVKANMPFGASYLNPQLSDEEAWDVAAFVNSQPRPPHPFLKTDWPKIEKKPYDHPFGPFADPFPESQHKYGPFEEIKSFYSSTEKK